MKAEIDLYDALQGNSDAAAFARSIPPLATLRVSALPADTNGGLKPHTKRHELSFTPLPPSSRAAVREFRRLGV